MLGGQFEKGLQNLKKYCETQAAGMPQVQIQEMDFPAHMYAGVRQVVNMADMGKFFMDNMPNLGKGLGAKEIGAPVGLYWTWDTVSHTTELAAAMPVSDTSKKVKGISYFYVPASKAYMTAYKGPYSGIGNPHMAISKYMANKGLQHGLIIDEYVTDPGKEKDSTKWQTNIYYLVK